MRYEVDVERRLMRLEERVNGMLRPGRIAAVQSRPYRVRVNLNTPDDPALTDWIPTLVYRAGATLAWSPLTEGEGCLVLTPGGIIGEGPSYALPALFTGRVEPYADGAPSDDTIYISGDVRIGGAVVAASVADSGGELAALRSDFKNHKHVAPAGGGPTSKPGLL